MAHQSPHVAPLDKTRLCHLPCWHPSTPPPTIPYHLCHINTPSCPSTTQAHNNASFAASASSAAPIDSEGPLDLWHHQPTSERCQTVSSHRGGVTVSHVSRDYNHSSLLIILDGAQRETERRREREFVVTFEKLIDSQVLLSSLFPPKTAVDSCGYWSLAYSPPSRVAPAVLEWLTADKEEIGVEHSVAKFEKRMNDK